MKKQYIKPTMSVVKMQHRSQLMQPSQVHTTSNNANLGLGGSDSDYIGEDGDIR